MPRPAGLAFDGGAGQIKFVNPLLGSVPHTISAWLDQRTTEAKNQMDPATFYTVGPAMADR